MSTTSTKKIPLIFCVYCKKKHQTEKEKAQAFNRYNQVSHDYYVIMMMMMMMTILNRWFVCLFLYNEIRETTVAHNYMMMTIYITVAVVFIYSFITICRCLHYLYLAIIYINIYHNNGFSQRFMTIIIKKKISLALKFHHHFLLLINFFYGKKSREKTLTIIIIVILLSASSHSLYVHLTYKYEKK